MQKLSYCIFCMNPIEDTNKACPNCKKSIWEYHLDKECIKPGVMLKNDRYYIGAVKGRGGFGITYIAKDTVLDVTVAIKEFFPRSMLFRDSLQDELNVSVSEASQELIFQDALHKYIEEARLLSKFDKLDGVVSVLDFFEENNTAYIVFEYISGGTLKSRIKNETITEKDLLEKIRPVLFSLAQLHNVGVIHGDISLDNIMVTESEEWKLIDFGSAYDILNDDDRKKGLNPNFAPPELYNKEAVAGPWSDIYSLCVVMYRLLSGKFPPVSIERYPKDTLKAISLYVPIDSNLEKVIMDGLNMNPTRRHFYIGMMIKSMYSDVSDELLFEWASNARKLWGDNWITASSMLLRESSNKRKRLSKKQMRRVAIVVAVLVLPILAGIGYDQWLWKNNPLKAAQYFLNRQMIIYNPSSSLEVAEPYEKGKYEELISVLEKNAIEKNIYEEDEDSELIEEEEESSYDFPSNKISLLNKYFKKTKKDMKFFITYDIFIKYLQNSCSENAEFVYDQKNSYEDVVSFDSFVEDVIYVGDDNGDGSLIYSYDMEDLFYYSNLRADWTLYDNGKSTYEIVYDPFNKTVSEVDLTTKDEKVLKKALKEDMQLLIPYTFWTDEEIDDAISNLKNGKIDSVIHSSNIGEIYMSYDESFGYTLYIDTSVIGIHSEKARREYSDKKIRKKYKGIEND